MHIKRHSGLNLGINTQDFGPHAGTVLVQMVGDPIKVPGAVGKQVGIEATNCIFKSPNKKTLDSIKAKPKRDNKFYLIKD